MIVRVLAPLTLALVCAARPCAASCEEIAWDLRDVLRDLVRARVAQPGPLTAAQVEAALRERALPFTKPVFRFARGSSLERVAVGARPEDLAPCEVSEVVREVPTPEGSVNAAASLRVESAVVAFDAEVEEASWRVVARVREDVAFEDFELVVAARVGPARRHPLRREGPVLRGVVPRGALEGPVTMQIVARTPLGPEVVAELRVGGASAANGEAPARAEPSLEALLAALNAARASLASAPLRASAPLQRVAEQTLTAALARGVLVHRTPEGLVGERLKVARIAHARAGELLARIGSGESAVERFLASPAHRLVLGDARLRSVGIAEAQGPDGLRWIVVVLATP